MKLDIDGCNDEETILKLIETLPYKFTLSKSAYYYNKTAHWTTINPMTDVLVKMADTPLIKTHGKYVDVSANYITMTMEFAIRRINRKFEIYDDVTKCTHFYVCYHNEEPVGNCEFHRFGNVAKIEDFDILEMHQRKGYGSQVLRALMKEAENQKAEIAYVVTDFDETAKEMYMKNGFAFAGMRYEIMIHIK